MIKVNLYLWKTSVMSDEVAATIFEGRIETSGLVVEIVGKVSIQKVLEEELRVWHCPVNKRQQSC